MSGLEASTEVEKDKHPGNRSSEGARNPLSFPLVCSTETRSNKSQRRSKAQYLPFSVASAIALATPPTLLLRLSSGPTASSRAKDTAKTLYEHSEHFGEDSSVVE